MLYNLIILATQATTKAEPSFWYRLAQGIFIFMFIMLCVGSFISVSGKPGRTRHTPW